MNRSVPETLHLLVQHRYRHGATGHIERGDAIADQRSGNEGAGWLEQFTFYRFVKHQLVPLILGPTHRIKIDGAAPGPAPKRHQS